MATRRHFELAGSSRTHLGEESAEDEADLQCAAEPVTRLYQYPVDSYPRS